MGNFDFIKDGNLLERGYWDTVEENLANVNEFDTNQVHNSYKSFFSKENIGNNRSELFKLFNEAEMCAKIDIYYSAARLRQAWNYLLFGIIPRNPVIEPDYSTISRYKVFFRNIKIDQENFNNIDDINIDSDSLIGQYVNYYIRRLGNTGTHEAEQTNNDLDAFFQDLTFDKLAFGLSLSSDLLSLFFERSSKNKKYKYKVHEIPFERYDTVDTVNMPSNIKDTFLPKRYVIGRHEFEETGGELSTYAIIKEYRLNDPDIIEQDSLHNRSDYENSLDYKKLQKMKERQNYVLAVSNGFSQTNPVSVYTSVRNQTPFRYISYMLPTFSTNLLPLAENKPLLPINQVLNEAVFGFSFYIELAEIFVRMEEKGILIRGIRAEDVWVYCTENEKYHPLFTAAELCKVNADNNADDREYVNTIQETVNQLMCKHRISLVNNRLKYDNREFIAPFFVLVFDTYCNSFGAEYDNDQDESVVLSNMRNLFDNARYNNSDELCGVAEYIGRMLTALENAKQNDSEQNDPGRLIANLDGMNSAQHILNIFQRTAEHEPTTMSNSTITVSTNSKSQDIPDDEKNDDSVDNDIMHKSYTNDKEFDEIDNCADKNVNNGEEPKVNSASDKSTAPCFFDRFKRKK